MEVSDSSVEFMNITFSFYVNSKHWLCNDAGKHWLCNDDSKHWLCNDDSKHWLCNDAGKHWLCNDDSKHWLCNDDSKVAGICIQSLHVHYSNCTGV